MNFNLQLVEMNINEQLISFCTISSLDEYKCTANENEKLFHEMEIRWKRKVEKKKFSAMQFESAATNLL